MKFGLSNFKGKSVFLLHHYHYHRIVVLSLNAPFRVGEDRRRMSESRQSSGRKAQRDLHKLKQTDKKVLYLSELRPMQIKL